MALSKEHFRIAEILAKYFINPQTKDKKRKHLQKKLERFEELEDLLAQKGKYETYEKSYARFNPDEGWEHFCKHNNIIINDSKNKNISSGIKIRNNWYKIAAIIILTFATGITYWYLSSSPESPRQILTANEIKINRNGAFLTLGNGQPIQVNQKEAFFKEDCGKFIVSDSSGKKFIEQTLPTNDIVKNTIHTAKGMEYTLTLEDGTRVFLNADTKMTFPSRFQGNQREVELKGEAFFEVAKDSIRPFIIKMQDINIQVLGTSFNVCFYDNQATTTLVEGKIQINSKNKQVTLIPGEQAIYNFEKNDLSVKEVDVNLYTSWREGKFLFKNERLEDMLTTLSRWYDIKYHFTTPETKDLKIGAQLERYSHIDTIIDMLKMNPAISIKKINNEYYIGKK